MHVADCKYLSESPEGVFRQSEPGTGKPVAGCFAVLRGRQGKFSLGLKYLLTNIVASAILYVTIIVVILTMIQVRQEENMCRWEID